MPRLGLAAQSVLAAGCSLGGPAPASPAVVDDFLLPAGQERATVGSAVLETGVVYVVTVSGTVSLYDRWHWGQTCAGTPDPEPMFGSGDRTGPVGVDPAYEFAMPSTSSVCDRGAPTLRSGWVYKARANDDWTPAETTAGLSSDHTYSYQVLGLGEPLRTRIRETGRFSDNYGAFRVTVARAGETRR